MQPQDSFPPPTGQQPYGTPPLGQQSYGGFQQPVRSDVKIIFGFILAFVSIGFLPIIFGPIAILLGYLAKKDGDSRGKVLLVTAVACMVLGFVLGVVFASALS